MIGFLILGGIFLTLLYHYLTKPFKHWQKLGIAYEEPSIIFGNIGDSFLMRCNRAEIFDRLYNMFPGEKVVGWYNFRKPALVVRDPELVHKVLVTDFHSFRNNDIDSVVPDDPLSRNIFALKDDEWKKSRALITPAFTAGRIKPIFPQMREVAKDLVQYLKKHPEELHVKDTMSRYTTEIIAKCAFGIEGNAFKEEKSEIHQVGRSIFAPSLRSTIIFSAMMSLPFLNKLFKLRIVSADVSAFFDSILKDVILYRQKNNVERNDLVQYFVELKKKTIEVEKGNIKSDLITRKKYYIPAYTDDDVLAGCLTFFIEAYETSALLIAHCLYNLALNKDAQDKLREEVEEEMEKGDISFEKLNEMTYLNAVLQETNRITPVAHYLFKRCTEKYEMDLGDKKIPIEKGTSITVPLYGLQNDPAYWEDPETFKPERFLNKNDVDEAKTKSVFMPFGNGPRMCIGVRISSTIVKLALFHVVSQFEVLPTSKTPKKMDLDPYYLMTTHKGGIYLRFADRNQ